jgi:thiamine-phosphate pyrophosphorylase
VASDGTEAAPRTSLYLISPPAVDLNLFAGELAAALEGGEVGAFQLRLKDTPDDEILAAAARLMPLCHAHDVAFILNDRPDLAQRAGADGVHVGDEDAPYAEARQIMGAEATVGVTCRNSIPMAMDAAEAGADYVAFGAFFPSPTKEATVQAEIDLLAWWAKIMLVPCVAIGGITTENCRPLVVAGADFLAVASGVWGFDAGPAAAVAAFNRVFDEVAGTQADSA